MNNEGGKVKYITAAAEREGILHGQKTVTPRFSGDDTDEEDRKRTQHAVAERRRGFGKRYSSFFKGRSKCISKGRGE